MAVRLNDDETEKFVLGRQLITPERLAPFRVQASVDSSQLFDLMVSEGVITQDMIAELEKTMPPPAAPRSIRSGGTTFLSRAPDAGPASTPSSANLTSTPSGGTAIRRPARARSFEDDFGGAKSGAQPAVGGSGASSALRPAVTPSTSAAPPVNFPTTPAPQFAMAVPIHTGKLEAPRKPHGWPNGLAPADPSPNHVQRLLQSAREQNASDLYISAGTPLSMRIDGKLRISENQPALTADQAAGYLRQLLTAEQWHYFEHHNEISGSYSYPQGGRFRINAVKHRYGCDTAIRIVPQQIRTIEELGLPPPVAKLTQFSEGLIVVASPAGNGKTTSALAMVDALNRSRQGHIVTLEDPIEILLPAQSCQVTQREIGAHSGNFSTALESTLREDPDIILVGELRDHETTHVALRAAESGHLVYGTINAWDCARAIDRLFETPHDPQASRNMVADNLRAVLAQQLVQRADGQGRVVACELLINSISVANIIREAKTQNLVNVMQTGKQQGLIMFDDSLRSLIDAGHITGEEAYSRAKNKASFKQYLPEKEAAPDPNKPAEAPKPTTAPVPPLPPKR